MQKAGDDAADDGLVSLTDAQQKEDLGQQKTHAQVFVYRVPIRLQPRQESLSANSAQV